MCERQTGQPAATSATVSAHLWQKRACPRGATRQTSQRSFGSGAAAAAAAAGGAADFNIAPRVFRRLDVAAIAAISSFDVSVCSCNPASADVSPLIDPDQVRRFWLTVLSVEPTVHCVVCLSVVCL